MNSIILMMPADGGSGNSSLFSTLILILIIVVPTIYFSIKWYITSMKAFRAIIDVKTDLQALNNKSNQNNLYNIYKRSL